MKTKKCKHCKEEIAKDAKRCPKCGGKQGMPGWTKAIIIIIIIIFCLVGCVNGCTNAVDDAVKETKNSYNDINGKTSFKINETFQNKYEKITMTEVNTNFTDYNEYVGPKEGNKVIAVKFEIENINDENDELYVSSLEFNAYVDGVAVDHFYGAADSYNDITATLRKGKKAIGYVFYEVPLNSNEIKVEYNANFWVDGTATEFVIQE